MLQDVLQVHNDIVVFLVLSSCWLLVLILRHTQEPGSRLVVIISGIMLFSGIVTARLSFFFQWSLRGLTAGLILGGIFALLRNRDHLRRLKRQRALKPNWPSFAELFLLGLVSPLSEEVFYRASLQGNFERLLPGYWAIILTSLLFGLHHAIIFRGEIAVSRYLIPFPLVANAFFPFSFSVTVGFVYLHFKTLLAVYLAHVMVNVSVLLVSATLKETIRARFNHSVPEHATTGS